MSQQEGFDAMWSEVEPPKKKERRIEAPAPSRREPSKPYSVVEMNSVKAYYAEQLEQMKARIARADAKVSELEASKATFAELHEADAEVLRLRKLLEEQGVEHGSEYVAITHDPVWRAANASWLKGQP